MRIPTEHFSSIPPNILTSKKEKNDRSLKAGNQSKDLKQNSAGSAPNTPDLARKASQVHQSLKKIANSDDESEESASNQQASCSGPVSLPVKLKPSKKK